MPKQQLYAGIDIGSDKIVCVAGTMGETGDYVKVLSSSIINCPDGIKAGVITNMQEAIIAIRKACYECENIANGEIKDAVIALRGNYIESRNSKGLANTADVDGRITEDTVIEVLDNVKKMGRLGAYQEIFQIVPKEFTVSNQKGIKNPVGKEGTFLEVDAISFVAFASNINDIRFALDKANVPCKTEVYGYTAASEIIVTIDEKKSGCLVIDFGHFTTGIVLYVDGILKYVGELPAGSYHITKDIGHILKISLSAANVMKENYEYGDIDKKAGFEVKGLHKALVARLDELLTDISEALTKNGYDKAFLSGGIIITGSGSKLSGITKYCKKYFECAVRIGQPLPNIVRECTDEIILNPACATAIGALTSFINQSYDLEPKRYTLWDKLLQLIDKYI
jgi:cell division protein FtsA